MGSGGSCLYSIGSKGSATSVQVSRRWRRLALPLAALLAVLVWAPVPVARHYAHGPGGADVPLSAIDRGWEFVYHAVTLSRGAELGTDEVALERARLVWAGPPARATSVDLVYLDGDGFEVPVPEGGAAPPASRARVEGGDRLAWRVDGVVRGGPRQMIGLLDYDSGDVRWDIRPLTEDDR